MGYDYDRRAATKDVVAVAGIGKFLVDAFKMGVQHGGGNLHEAKDAATYLSQLASKAAGTAFQPSKIALVPTGSLDELGTAIHDLAFAMGAASVKPTA